MERHAQQEERFGGGRVAVNVNLAYLSMAYVVAGLSQEQTQVGAVFVAKDGRVGTGFNHLDPAGFRGICHAERAAIKDVANRGSRTTGGVLYAPWHACTDCAALIVESGIGVVVGHANLRWFSHDHSPKWTQEVREGLMILKEAGVQSLWINGPLEAPSITVNGSTFNPRLPLDEQPRG